MDLAWMSIDRRLRGKQRKTVRSAGTLIALLFISLD